MSDPRVEMRLEVDGESDPITGLLRDRSGQTHRFEGWMQLMAEVDRARSEAPEDPSPETDNGRYE